MNEWDGMTHDYTHKGGIVHTEIMLPAHAPPEFQDRSTLWNSVEQIEKSSDAKSKLPFPWSCPRLNSWSLSGHSSKTIL